MFRYVDWQLSLLLLLQASSGSLTSTTTATTLVHGFTSSTLYSASTRGTTSSTTTTTRQWASVDPFVDEGPDLYKILGASPKDSTAELKRKWQQLARRLHPDANVQARNNNININMMMENGDANGNAMNNPNGEIMNNLQQPQPSDDYPYDLSVINAAWGVLSDPKQRRRYDRALQAKEMADTFEILLDAGIKNAIPFFKKTADTTLAAVETSTKTWVDVNKRMKHSAAVFEVEKEGRDLELQASRAMAKMKQLQTQLETQNDRRVNTLQTPNVRLTSAEALRLLQKFSRNADHIATDEAPVTTQREIQTLQALEADYNEKAATYQATERASSMASRQAAEAIRAEQRAQERLLQAKRDLAEAQARNQEMQQVQIDAVQAEQAALAESQEVSSQLQQQTEQVRYWLRQNEDRAMQREALVLQAKLKELQVTIQELQVQAQDMKTKAKELKARQQLEEQQNSN